MVISTGKVNQTLIRTSLLNKDFRNQIEIIEGTFQFLKIEMKDILAPLKIYIRYSSGDSKLYGDL